MDRMTVTRALQLFGIGGAAFVAGGNLTTTITAIPPLLRSPSSLLAIQFDELYHRGLVFVVPIVLTSAASMAGLAYQKYQDGGTRSNAFRLYAVAAVTTGCYGLFTRNVMGQNIDRLLELAATAKPALEAAAQSVVSDDEVHSLVARWGTLNGIRGSLTAIGAILAFLGISASS